MSFVGILHRKSLYGYILLFLAGVMLLVFFNNTQPCDNTVVKSDSSSGISHDPNTSSVNSEWQALLNCQAIRLRRLQERCQELGLMPEKPLHEFTELELQRLGGKYLVDDLHHVILRAIPKTGCTSWKLLLLNNTKHVISWIDKPPGPHSWSGLRDKLGMYTLREYNKPAILSRLKSYLTILTVRHPLSRLESGFRDKALGSAKTKLVINNNRTHFFSQTVFELFQKRVNIWTKGYHPNPHFKGIFASANPCTVPVSFIAKTETAKEEMRYILQERLSNIGDPVQKNPSKKLTHDRHSNTGAYLELFSGLKDPEKTVKEVVSEYKKDMYLFGYDYKVTKDGVYATCERYDYNGMCC